MNIAVEIEHGADIAEGVDIEGVARYVLAQEGQPETTEVSITLTTDEEVHRLNREFRGIDRPTDVLSFECDGFDDDFDEGGAYEDAGVPDDEPFLLGDIIIASDVARAQTEQFGTTPQQELYVLLVHGLLHLCGWDHVHSDEEAEEMEARERETSPPRRRRFETRGQEGRFPAMMLRISDGLLLETQKESLYRARPSCYTSTSASQARRFMSEQTVPPVVSIVSIRPLLGCQTVQGL